MTTTYAGNLTVGQCVPAAASANAEVTASANASLGDVTARITGLLSLQANLIANPPNPLALIAQLNAIIASLSLPAPPSVPQLDALASVLAELSAISADLTASLAFSTALGGQLATPGVHLYAFAGAANALGGELSAHLSAGLTGGSGPGQQIAGVILLAGDAGAIAALQSVMGP